MKSPTAEMVNAAMTEEKDAEIAYLRERNLSLSIAVQNLAARVKELQEQLEDAEPSETEAWDCDGTASTQ